MRDSATSRSNCCSVSIDESSGRGAQRASRRTACLVRRHAADSREADSVGEPTDDASKMEDRGKASKGPTGTEWMVTHARERRRQHANHAKTERDTCDLSRGTATTEPFETSTSCRAPSSRSPRRSEPYCRYIALSLLSLSLDSFSLFPPYCSSIILSLLLPPFTGFSTSLFSLVVTLD